MALENIQYDAIMREYDRRQSQNRRRLEEHREHAYRQVPQLKEIQDAIASSSAQRIRSRLKGDCSESSSAYEKSCKFFPKSATAFCTKTVSLPITWTCPANAPSAGTPAISAGTKNALVFRRWPQIYSTNKAV